MFGKIFARFRILVPSSPQGLRHNRDLAPFMHGQPVAAAEVRSAVLVRHYGRM
jgi:hypothetical protein